MTMGLFGKIPARADFIRHDASHPSAMELINWLQYAVEAIKTARQPLPEAIIRFAFSPKGTSDVLIGALGPSRDQVGREFPLAVFVSLPGGDLAGRFSRVPVAFDPFLEQVRGVLADAAHTDYEALCARVQSLPVPTGAQMQQAEQICQQTLATAPAPELPQRLFDVERGEHYYAFNTFLTACNGVRGTEPGGAGTVLDCPITIDVDLFGWLDLAQRLLRWPTRPPSFFWVEEPVPRLLISLGLVHVQVLGHLSDPGQQSQRLWPLTTRVDAAIEVARGTLGPALAPLQGDPPPALGWLLDTLEQIGSQS